MIGFLIQLVAQIILLIARLTMMAGYQLGTGIVLLISFLLRWFKEAPRRVAKTAKWPATDVQEERPLPRPLLPKPWEQRSE